MWQLKSELFCVVIVVASCAFLSLLLSLPSSLSTEKGLVVSLMIEPWYKSLNTTYSYLFFVSFSYFFPFCFSFQNIFLLSQNIIKKRGPNFLGYVVKNIFKWSYNTITIYPYFIYKKNAIYMYWNENRLNRVKFCIIQVYHVKKCSISKSRVLHVS